MIGSLNDPYAQNGTRKPRARIMNNGSQMPFPIEFTVTSTNNLTADKFNIDFPLYADPSYNIAWWQSQTSMMIDIQIGFLQPGQPANASIQYASLVQGQIDSFVLNPTSGIVQCQGRDLASVFIDTKIATSYQNMTSSQIVSLLATSHGLQANVDPTDTFVGRYYDQDHTNTNQGEFSKTTTEWDFMCFLARQENYDLYVKGNTLFFKQAVNETNPGAGNGTWSVISPQLVSFSNGVANLQQAGSVKELKISRSLTLAKDVKVEVIGWHSKNGKSFKAIAERKQGGSQGGKNTTAIGEGVQSYVYYVHNVSTEQARTMANNLLSEISKHEFVIEWNERGDLALTPQCIVMVSGTNSAFDAKYYIDNIEYKYGMSQGFDMSVKAKNHRTQNQSAV